MKHNRCRALITLIYLTIAIDVCQAGDHAYVHGSDGENFARKYPFSVTLHEGFYHLYWNFSTVDETIQFAVKVKTTGWVGFGISPNGQMPGSDVIIAWVDGDKAYFQDRYAERRSLPTIDRMQDWFLLSAAVHEGYTELEFSRNFTTCDNESQDLDIVAETSHIVYSWNNNKPTVSGRGDSETYSIEQHQIKGSARINFLGGLPSDPQIPENTPQFILGVTNVEIPNVDTTYWCKGIKLSSVIEDIDYKKYYIVKFEPALSESSKDYVHHIVVYTCNGLIETDLGHGGECSKQSERMQNCRGIGGVAFAAWAVGGTGFVYPESVAYPIGGPNSHMNAMVEIHYNNPNEDLGIFDSSGISLFYYDTPREHDAGALGIGASGMVIPPKATKYTIPGFCPSECTNAFLPPEGITIFANLLHTHLAGIGLSLSILKPGTHGKFIETAVVEKNMKYDFNYQQINHLPKDIILYPGDTLQLNCYYNTEGRNVTTLGGESTQEEMCVTFSFYYPKQEMSDCFSEPQLDELASFVEEFVPVDKKNEFENITTDSTPRELADALNSLKWSEEQISGFQQHVYISGNQDLYCYSDDLIISRSKRVPVVYQYFSPHPVRNCSLMESEPDGAAVVCVQLSLLLIIMTLTFMCLP